MFPALSKPGYQARVAALFDDPKRLRGELGDVAVPPAVAAWLGRLTLLHGVPFNYLVPDEGMLPPESIRFFYLDGNWSEALVDGAFSIGRCPSAAATAANLNLDRAVRPELRAAAAARAAAVRATALGVAAPPTGLRVVSGFVLRSSLVSSYPGLGVNAYAEGRSGDDALPILRLEPLGPASDTLICLVDGDAARYDIHEAPEHLHYGVDDYAHDPVTGAVTVHKVLHTFTKAGSEVSITGTTPPQDIAPYFRAASPRVLTVAGLAAFIGSNNDPPADLDAAELGFEMTEGVGMVSFTRAEGRS